MGKIAFLFSGQGAQKPGMGRSFYDAGCCEGLFSSAEALRPGTLEQCFSGSAGELSQTVNTQPCLYLCDMAAASALAGLGVRPDGAAGFSLGELAALCFSGAYSFETGFELVMRRGELMSRAAEEKPASMAAVLRLPPDKVAELCEKYGDVYPVNFNSAQQTVVSGGAESLERFKADVAAAGGKAMPLKVTGGFHSPFMASAAEGFSEFLAGRAFSPLRLPVYANATAEPYAESPALMLPRQIKSPVLWEKTIQNMCGAGFDTFIEVGVGSVLCGLVRRIAPEAKALCVEDMDGARRAAGEVLCNA